MVEPGSPGVLLNIDSLSWTIYIIFFLASNSKKKKNYKQLHQQPWGKFSSPPYLLTLIKLKERMRRASCATPGSTWLSPVLVQGGSQSHQLEWLFLFYKYTLFFAFNTGEGAQQVYRTAGAQLCLDPYPKKRRASRFSYRERLQWKSSLRRQLPPRGLVAAGGNRPTSKVVLVG